VCISAPASFGLSGVLLLTGVYCVTRAVRTDRRLLGLAVVPLIFGIQQFCEGWVWVGVDRSDSALARASALWYLFFALLLWPVWAGLSTMPVESRRGARDILRVAMLAGAALGACLYLPILIHPQWLSVEVVRHSIYYNTSASPLKSSIPSIAWELVYLTVVAVPFLISPHRRLFHLGLALVLSAGASHVFFSYAGASIWCFFAAVISAYLGTLFYRAPARVAPVAAG
jgi:hypothetical protein